MKARDGRLWVASTNAFWTAPQKTAAVLAFDLRSGKPLASHTHPDAQSFNDLDVAPNGDLYVSDSLGGAVFRLPADGSAMQAVIAKGSLGYPNGVAVSGDGRHLFVAHGAGPVRLDLATRELLRLPRPADFSGLGIDGLYWRNGGLVGVQNVGTPGRVVRMELSPERDRITGWRLLEAGHPEFDTPTTGALADGRMFVIANAQLRRMGEDGRVRDAAAVKPIVILELPA
jgi:streptogramin lyase